MPGFEMLDVAIGIIFIYLLLSLICSALHEFIEAKLKLRAVDLEQGIRELLNDPSGSEFVKKIYEHPLICGLYRGSYATTEIRNVDKKNAKGKSKRYSRGSDLPSYIPARNFALALMDVVLPAQPATTEEGAAAKAQTLSGSAGSTAPKNQNVQVINTEGLQHLVVKANPMQPLREAVNSIAGNNHLKKALLTIIDAAGNDAVKAREGIENWYNSSMDRVSGWYKRRVQQIVFAMGFAVAIAMNADTFAIFNNLVNDRPLRTAVVATALSKKSTIADTSGDSLKRNISNVLELGLPIGWRWKSAINPQEPYSNFNAIPKFTVHTTNDTAYSLLKWFLKIIGWLLTGLAVSLGAPFWFDILNKVMVVRSTVKPTEKSPDEASQDRKNKS